mmetsp:Transcript_458/g.1395  ORF Transcript_458/g.1395 Transcript_458/m.1395 type:complete len:82 (-) Transcript_458:354-599(-)
MTSYSTNADGTVNASMYRSDPRQGTYTNKSSRQYVEKGKSVTIKTMEKDGNKIEDKYVGRTLVERRINGKVERLERIEGGL